MHQLSSKIAGSAQQVALLEKRVKELEDVGYQQAAEIMFLKESHNKDIEELKVQLTQMIDERIYLADQLEQSKKSNITLKDKYQALHDEKKSTIASSSRLVNCSSADIFSMHQLISC